MHLFVIPSWYPSRSNPTGGIFTRVQSRAVAELHPEMQVSVSTWGHDSGFLDHRHPTKLLKSLLWYARSPQSASHAEENFTELFKPCLTWSNRAPVTDTNRLISVNRHNLNTAVRLYGRPDIIHAHVSYPAGYIAAQLSQEFKIPYIMTEHMSPFPFPQYFQHGQLRPEIYTAFNNAAASIAVSESLSNSIEQFGIRRPLVIPNLVDESAFKLHKPAPSPPFIFFTLCVMTDQKGVDHLLRSIAHWQPASDDVAFRIGGDGPKLHEYQQLAKDLNIADRIQWLGSLDQAQAVNAFAQCHAYVMPSRHETFGVVYAESIASGKPVIATRCGGPEEIVNVGNGILVDIDNEMQLIDAMQTIIETYDQYDSESIRTDFLERFSKKAVVKQLMQQYRLVTGAD